MLRWNRPADFGVPIEEFEVRWKMVSIESGVKKYKDQVRGLPPVGDGGKVLPETPPAGVASKELSRDRRNLM